MLELMARTHPSAAWAIPFESNTWVRAARRELGLGQVEFARVLGMTQSNVSKWENGGLSFSRDAAYELYRAMDLPDALDPTSPEPCESDDDVASRYAEHTTTLIIQSAADADWRAAQLCASMSGQAGRSVESGRILASIYANRSLWHLVHQDLPMAARHAQTAIRLGKRNGFNVDSGYAFWSLARTRFIPGFGSVEDIELLNREIGLAESRRADVPNMFVCLLRGARAVALGDEETAATEFERAKEDPPMEAQWGVVARWSAKYWQRDITMYQAMVALCSERYRDCSRLIEPLAEECFEPTVPIQYGQTVARHYFQAANARLGWRQRVETDGPLVPPSMLANIKRHTKRLVR